MLLPIRLILSVPYHAFDHGFPLSSTDGAEPNADQKPFSHSESHEVVKLR